MVDRHGSLGFLMQHSELERQVFFKLTDGDSVALYDLIS